MRMQPGDNSVTFFVQVSVRINLLLAGTEPPAKLENK